jgi:hypothetical protein
LLFDFNLYNGQVSPWVGAYNLGAHGLLVAQPHIYFVGIPDHVIVGKYMTLGVNNYAGSQSALRHWRKLVEEIIAEEVA